MRDLSTCSYCFSLKGPGPHGCKEELRADRKQGIRRVSEPCTGRCRKCNANCERAYTRDVPL